AKSQDFAIAGGKTSETIPFRLLNNHIYIQVRIGGKPFQFLFDTGGVNILTPEAAQRLGLKSEGALEMRGVGEKSADTSLAQVPELAIGDLTLRDQVFFIVPLTGVDQAEGMRVDGIVGYELIKRFIARVEYAESRLTLTLPEAFQEPAGAAAIPITFDGGTPQVEGELDGVKGLFTIDTGSRASLSVNGPFARENGLEAKLGKPFEAMSGWGVGGGTRSLMARARELKLGGVAIPSPVIDIALGEKGALANRYLAGNVGGGVLRRFDVTFDYNRQRMYLRPNADFAKPDTYDRAGMWLNGEGDHFKVMDVVNGGPAAEAGLHPGDEVLAIDGKSVRELSLPEVRTRFRTAAPGTKVVLEVRSGGEAKKVQIALREMV
ncbi:MAG: aspartyl protease family protein, partial [Thermoanaerobaculia bacterium]